LDWFTFKTIRLLKLEAAASAVGYPTTLVYAPLTMVEAGFNVVARASTLS